MMESAMDPGIEAQIAEWRNYLLRRRTIHHIDVDELEDHLRSQMNELGAAGLSGEESFLVAIKRVGSVNELSREFARERSSRLWKQLVLAGDSVRDRSGFEYLPFVVMACFAIGAAAVFKLPRSWASTPSALPKTRPARRKYRSTSATRLSWRCPSSRPTSGGSGASQLR